MVSIGKLINQKSENVLRYVRPLFAAISRTAIEADPHELANFREKVEDLSQELSERSNPEKILEHIAALTRLLEEYNQSVTNSGQSYRNEMRSALSMMTDTIAAISQSNQAGVEQLRAIENSLVSAAALTDLKALRNKLSVCLTLVRNENVRAQHESEKLLTSLKTAVLRASSRAVSNLDRATALPGPGAAGQMIGTLINEGKTFQIVMFLLDGVQGLNARFGRTAGDEALLFAAQHLGSDFAQYGPLLRWNGPAFLLISEDANRPLEVLERLVKNTLRKTLEAPISIESRILRVPLTFSWTSQQVMPTESVTGLCRKLDGLVAMHSGTPSAS